MLELRDVQAYYGNIQALKGVTLNVQAGEIVTLVGANGAGKSTTLMTISSVVGVRSGSITFEGKDITKTSTDKVVAMGITQVPEGRMIFPALTVLENLRMGGYLRRDKAGLEGGRGARLSSCFPFSRSAASSTAAPFPAASSRCWPSPGP
jgi:branched-chain amino acid transport system ATP-binding protein